jgi:hypothetical protein
VIFEFANYFVPPGQIYRSSEIPTAVFPPVSQIAVCFFWLRPGWKRQPFAAGACDGPADDGDRRKPDAPIPRRFGRESYSGQPEMAPKKF